MKLDCNCGIKGSDGLERPHRDCPRCGGTGQYEAPATPQGQHTPGPWTCAGYLDALGGRASARLRCGLRHGPDHRRARDGPSLSMQEN
jgi:hypothetical protein